MCVLKSRANEKKQSTQNSVTTQRGNHDIQEYETIETVAAKHEEQSPVYEEIVDDEQPVETGGIYYSEVPNNNIDAKEYEGLNATPD